MEENTAALCNGYVTGQPGKAALQVSSTSSDPAWNNDTNKRLLPVGRRNGRDADDPVSSYPDGVQGWNFDMEQGLLNLLADFANQGLITWNSAISTCSQPR